MIRLINRKKEIILVSVLILQLLPIAYATAPAKAIYFKDKYGYDREYFFVYDTICISGKYFEPNFNYTISLVKNTTLANNIAIPESAPDTTTMVTTDPYGNITLTEIWSQWNNEESHYLPTGEYYIIIDVDNDGIYNQEVDIIDFMIIKYGAGITPKKESEEPQFFTPEFPAGSIMALIAFLLAALIIRSQKIQNSMKQKSLAQT